jgi:broad specificity phosphatase PhoE
MLVYLVRHALSLFNARLEAGLNSGLSPLGIRQVEALVQRLSGTQFTAVYSSPFRRCLDTALPIARRFGLPVRLRPELCEFHGLSPGDVRDSGLLEAEILAKADSGVVICEDWLARMDWPSLDDSLEEMIGRGRKFAAYLKARWCGEDDRILVVGHGSPIARLIEAWLTDQPGPSFRFVIDNATISLLRYRSGVSSLLLLNDLSHLRDAIAPDSLFGNVPDSMTKKGEEW